MSTTPYRPPGSPDIGQSTPIDGTFGFAIGVANPANPANPSSSFFPLSPISSWEPFAPDQPYVYVSGSITGALNGPASMPLRYGGAFTTNIQSVEINDFALASQPISPALADLVAHPERIHLSGVIVGGQDAYWDITLTIDPAPPIPEPASLLAFLPKALGLGYRHWNTRGSSKK